MTALQEYFRRTGVEKLATVKYQWDHWNRAQYFHFALEDDMALYETLSINQNLSVCCAVAERMSFLFSDMSRSGYLLEFAEACWLTQVDNVKIEAVAEASDDWTGPGDGVLYLALIILDDFITGADHDLQFALRSCWMTNLARHVEQDGGELLDGWLAAAIGRFDGDRSRPAELAYGDIFDPDFQRGSLVGPGLFVLDHDYSAEAGQDELGTLLDGARATNAFLRQAP